MQLLSFIIVLWRKNLIILKIIIIATNLHSSKSTRTCMHTSYFITVMYRLCTRTSIIYRLHVCTHTRLLLALFTGYVPILALLLALLALFTGYAPILALLLALLALFTGYVPILALLLALLALFTGYAPILDYY